MSSTTDRIERTIVVRAPRSRVWRALTDAREFGTWFGVKVEGTFAPGARVRGAITHKGCRLGAGQAESNASARRALAQEALAGARTNQANTEAALAQIGAGRENRQAPSAGDIERTLDRTLDLQRTLDRTLALQGTLERNRDLQRTLDRNIDLLRTLERSIDRQITLTRNPDLRRTLRETRDALREMIRDLRSRR